MQNKKWKRYRFYTKSIDDFRPLIFNPKYPWWCTGYSEENAIIVCYLPYDENLLKYWDDADNIDSEEKDEIIFTDRFDKPKWFEE